MKKTALAFVALLVLASCSEPGAPGALEDDPVASPNETEASSPGKKAGAGKKKPDGGDGKRKAGGKQGDNGSGEDDGGDDDGADDRYTEGAEEDDNSSALFTAAGRYEYKQSGYERFCSATSCERQDLPERQTIDVTVRDRTSERAVVVAEAEASGNRVVRTTTLFTRRVAAVTNVYTRFTYEGFTYENTYQPDPPVVSLRFPLSDGKRWSGEWRDSTSGTYSFVVAGREQIEVGGAAVQAFKIDYEMTFRGEFEGSSQGSVWIDPATRVAVVASGKLDLRSAFGRYTTDGRTQLTSGPRY